MNGRILPIIIFSQFCCASIWFATNGILTDLAIYFSFGKESLADLTSAVQFGFIVGTLFFALFTISDRFSPSIVFFVSSLLGAAFNLATLVPINNLQSLMGLRFFTGICLAGIYPVGMKIAADYYEKNLGKSLGLLVGALVLGTAFPHFLNLIAAFINWKIVIFLTSGLALSGGILMVVLVPNGPYRKPSQRADFRAFFSVFRLREFRSAAFGYFGHMWELYTFWAFIPLILSFYSATNNLDINIPLWSFLIIGIGAPACVLSGYISEKAGYKKVAATSLFLSFLCCLASPFIFQRSGFFTLISFLLFWGFTVVADSPLFSTLVAQNAPTEKKGTALTIVNCIGFAITILSLQALSVLQNLIPFRYLFLVLAIGPIMGLISISQWKFRVSS
ncbi:MAG: MFS family permease [Arcticibacterium sp.]|jgi:MFS family permease